MDGVRVYFFFGAEHSFGSSKATKQKRIRIQLSLQTTRANQNAGHSHLTSPSLTETVLFSRKTSFIFLFVSSFLPFWVPGYKRNSQVGKTQPRQSPPPLPSLQPMPNYTFIHRKKERKKERKKRRGEAVRTWPKIYCCFQTGKCSGKEGVVK